MKHNKEKKINKGNEMEKLFIAITLRINNFLRKFKCIIKLFIKFLKNI